MNPETTLEILPAAKTLAASLANASFRFVPATPDVYAQNLRLMSEETDGAVMGAAVRLMLFGEYARAVKVELKLKGDTGFQAWLADNVPSMSYEKIRVAMAVAGKTFAEHPELYDLGDAAKVQRVAQLVDGRSFSEFAQAVGAVRKPANQDPVTGKRLNFPPKRKPSPQEEEAAAQEERKANFLAAVDTLAQVVDEGAHSALSADELKQAMAVIRDQHSRLERYAALSAESRKSKAKGASPEDL